MKKALEQSSLLREIEELRNTERLHHLILDNTNDMIAIHRLADLRYEYVNPVTLEVLGYSQEELFSLSALELVHPDDMERVMNSMKENLPKGAGHDEFRYRKKDGSYVWLEVTGNILPMEGNETSFIIISRDITARKQMEAAMQKAYDELEEKVQARTAQLELANQQLKAKVEEQLRTQDALRESETYYRTIFENTGTATVIVDRDLKISAANLKTEKLTGYKRQELIGLNPFEKFATPESLALVQENYRLRMLNSASAPQDYEIECVDKHERVKNVVMNVAKVPNSEDLAVSILDITEQHQARTLLKESEARFRALFEKAPVAIAINRNGRTLLANKAYANLFGYESTAELIGTRIIEQVAPGCRRRIDDTISQREQGQALPPSHETTGMHKDGSTFPVFVQANNIALPDGPANVAFFVDITARKQAEEALQRQVESQNILLEISKQLANITTFNIDAFINLALRRIGEFDNNDRSYVFLFSEDGTAMINTNEWCAQGINPEIENLQEVPTSTYPWWMSKLRNRENIYIPCVADLPPEAQAEKEILQNQAIQSLVIVPMISEDKVIGFIGFDSVLKQRDWSQENIVILESVAQIVTKGLQRKSYSEALETSENYYRAIFENTGAATMIIEENMTISMVNDECGRILNCGKEDLIGAKWTNFIPPKKVENMKAYHHLRRTDPKAAPLQYEIQLMDKYGKCREGLLYADIITGTKKSVATFMDMTDFKRIDRALKAISAVNAAMIHAQTEAELLKTVCEKIVEIGGYSLAWVGYLLAAPEQKVKSVSEAGRNNGYTNKLNISLTDPKRSKGPTGTAIRTGKPVVCRNIKTDPNFSPWAKDALRRGFKSSMAIPLLENNKAFGALNIYSDEMGIFNSEEEELLIKMANDLAFAISFLRARGNSEQVTRQLELSLGKMQRLLMQAVASLGTALDIRDPYTAGHQKKVTQLAVAIAAEIGLPQEQIEGIAVAGNLHDIGKINVPSEILSKPGKLSALEFEIIKTHSQAGYEIIKDIEFPWPVAEVLLQHHERLDGSGYPRGLAGDGILKEAQIMGVADIVEAMASHRPYRAALGIDLALEEIVDNKGILYDPEVVDACVKLFRERFQAGIKLAS